MLRFIKRRNETINFYAFVIPVTAQLVSSKCLPILMYGTEACGLKKSDNQSLDLAVNRFLMKLFKTANISVIQDCVAFFYFELPSASLINRSKVFMQKYINCDNLLCKLFRTDTT
jgi:chromosome condensin MukBEF MukE localization factor